jgi:DNA replication protein DnaC
MKAEKNVLPVLLKQLKLSTMTKLWEELHEEAIEKGWTPARYLKVLCEHELSHRGDRRLARNMEESRLPRGKTLATFNFKEVPQLNKTQIAGFASGNVWISSGTNLLFFGPSGCGKSHLATAIGEGLIMAGYRVLFTRTTDLVQKLQAAKKESALPAALSKLNKYDCLIADDWGYAKKDQAEASVLFELISERYENKSMIITCNQKFSEWDQIFSNKAMTVAAVDRLIHHAHIFDLMEVESYRTKTALERVAKEAAART